MVVLRCLLSLCFELSLLALVGPSLDSRPDQWLPGFSINPRGYERFTLRLRTGCVRSPEVSG
jgi:hypothetical protein